MTMHMGTIKDLIKYHRAMENRAKNTVSMVGHYDAVQTLRHCVEIPSYVTGPFSRQWAMEALAEVMSEAADRELALGNAADNEQDRAAHEATHRLLINMTGQFIKASGQ
jgi:hypothetical protein